MNKEKRMEKIGKIIYAGLKNLYKSQTELRLDQFSVTVLECLMLLEREEYLESHKGENDAGNGTYSRSFRCLRTNSLQINIPRSRNGKFKPLMLELINRQREQVNQLALLLYRKGLSTRDVSAVIQEFFGESMSRSTVNNLAASFHEIRKKWENRPLDAKYKVIYCDALYTSLKRGTSYSKEAVHVIYGVKEDNTRELLLLEVNPTEGSSIWGEYLNKLRKRGVKHIDLIVADGVPYFEDEAKKHFPNADFQKCVAHLMRRFLIKVRPKDKKDFSSDLQEIFNNFDSTSTVKKAQEKVKVFAKNWKNLYPKMVEKLTCEDYMKHYFTYIDFHVDVRRMIYTTNSIENLNRQIRKITKAKVTFDKKENLLDLIYMVIKDFEANNWQKYPINQFKKFKRNHQLI